MQGLALTKIDVLTGMKEIRVCTGYKYRGKTVSEPPYDELELVEPIYESFPGWEEPISGCRRLADLPSNAQRYVEAIERLSGCPIWLVSVGPDREQTIVIKNPLAG
jgi:adenylosuccinate synthase